MRLMVRCGVAAAAALLCCWTFPLSRPSATAAAGPAGVLPREEKARGYTWHDYFAEQLAYNRETLGGAYRQVGAKGVWDDAAVKFLDRMAMWLTYGPARPLYQPADVPAPADLAADGKAVMDAGCTDPLVRYGYGAALAEIPGREMEAIDHLRDAARRLEAPGYPSYRAWSAAVLLTRLDRLTLRDPAFQQATDAHGVKMACGKLDDLRRRLMFEKLWEHLLALPREAQLRFLELLKGANNADAWVLNMLEGCIEVKLAWDSRGSGWADQVTPAGWEGFYKHLDRARASLTAAQQLAPKLPNAATEMITVAMGAGDGQVVEGPNVWFDRALAAQPDCREAYDRMLWATQPRWGGSYDAMYEIGVRAVREGRYDIEGPWQLHRVVDTIGIDSGASWADLLARPGIYEALDEMGAKYADAHRHDGKGARYTTYRAAIAWRSGRYAEARKHLEAVGERVVPEAFKSVDSEDPPAAIGHALAMSGPRAPRVAEAEAALKAGRGDAALAAFRALRGEAGVDPREAVYLDRRLARLERRAKLDAGEWVDVRPVGGLAGWQVLGGKWTAGDDGSLLGRSEQDPRKWATIVLGEPLGSRFEVSGTLAPATRGISGGIAVGQGGASALYVALLSRGSRATEGRDGLMPDVAVAPDSPVSFSMAYDDGAVTLTVNGVAGATRPRPSNRPITAAQPGLSLFGDARFTELKVRKLNGPAGRP